MNSHRGPSRSESGQGRFWAGFRLNFIIAQKAADCKGGGRERLQICAHGSEKRVSGIVKKPSAGRCEPGPASPPVMCRWRGLWMSGSHLRSGDTEHTELNRVVLSGRGRGAGDGGSGQKAWRCVFCGYWYDGPTRKGRPTDPPQTPGAKNVAFWGLSARAGMIIMGLLKYKPVVKRRTA